ncbi:coat protein [Fusarium mangiferae partitivirus 1]|nr:coat protein [Fusarium mangiferae partitivirus 1]
MSSQRPPTKVSGFELRTPAALAALSKRFAPVLIQEDETPVPPGNADYFSRMMLPTNIELDSGNYATIDCQFDTRFIKNYIEYHVASLYPSLDVKGHPYVSPLTIAGYCLTLFYAHIFNCDATFRPNKSWYCERLLSDAPFTDLNNLFLNCAVPQFLADLLTQISPVYDARRSNFLFVPSLAGYSHEHDFGRTIPPSLYYRAHHILASTRTNKDPDDVLDDFYASNIVEYNGKIYTPANYFGTWIGYTHPNWVNQDFHAFFNPIVGRALTQKPTFARASFAPDDYDENEFNIYEFLLLGSPDNLPLNTMLTGALSAFFHSQTQASPLLGNILSSISGTLLFSHSIEPTTMPTWTGKPYVQDSSPDDKSDLAHAAEHKFMIQPPRFTEKITFPVDSKDLVTNKYLIDNKTFDYKTDPIQVKLYDPRINNNPYVLYFQPYDVSPSSLGYTIACGLKIEHAEFTGIHIPIETPEDSLDDNNSQYLQSAVRLPKIRKIFAQSDPLPVAIMSRSILDRTSQAIAFSLRAMYKNVLPFFGNQNVSPDVKNGPKSIPGFTAEENHSNPANAATYYAGTDGTLGLPDLSIHLWSSYRVVHKHKKPMEKDISMLASLRHIYGLNVTLSRSKNPVLVIPH